VDARAARIQESVSLFERVYRLFHYRYLMVSEVNQFSRNGMTSKGFRLSDPYRALRALRNVGCADQLSFPFARSLVCEALRAGAGSRLQHLSAGTGAGLPE
jgi:hypothetical protein